MSKGLDEALETMYKSLSKIATGRPNGHPYNRKDSQNIARECLDNLDLIWPKIKDIKNDA